MLMLQITGRVFDSSTNQPIEGVIVEVDEHSGSILRLKINQRIWSVRILEVGSYNFSFRAKGV